MSILVSHFRSFSSPWVFRVRRLAREKRFLHIACDVVFYALSMALAFAGVGWLGGDLSSLERADTWVFIWVPLVAVAALSALQGHYSRFKGFWPEYGELLRSLVLVYALTDLTLIFPHIPLPIQFVLMTQLLSAFFIPVGRVLCKRFLMVCNRWFTPVVVVCSGEQGVEAALAIESNILMGFKVDCLVNIHGDAGVERVVSRSDGFGRDEVRRYRLLSFGQDWVRRVKNMRGHYLVIALDDQDLADNQSLISRLAAEKANFSVLPSMKGFSYVGAEVSPLFRHEKMHIRVQNHLAKRSHQAVKRIFDVVVALVSLIAISPLFVFIAYKVRADGGPVFYSQRRVGRHGQAFSCFKFRSMRCDADAQLEEMLLADEAMRDEYEQAVKLADDPRITPIGRWIRRSSMDELPQLFNVLRGDMSMVGPRPVPRKEFERYGEDAFFYLELLPGITGLWQISGRNHTSYQTRVDLDSWYARNWSLWGDIMILWKTAGVVFRREGAY